MAPEDTAEDQLTEAEYYRDMAEALGHEPEACGGSFPPEPAGLFTGILSGLSMMGPNIPPPIAPPPVESEIRVALRKFAEASEATIREELARMDKMTVRSFAPGSIAEIHAFHLVRGMLASAAAIAVLVEGPPEREK